MRDQNIGSVVVAEADEPLGIVTDRDLTLRIIAERRDPGRVVLRDVMSRYPIFLSIDRSLDDAIRTMREMRVHRLPIVNDDGKLEGMLSIDDVLTAVGGQLGRVAEAISMELVPRA